MSLCGYVLQELSKIQKEVNGTKNLPTFKLWKLGEGHYDGLLQQMNTAKTEEERNACFKNIRFAFYINCRGCQKKTCQKKNYEVIGFPIK